ncbi:MAG: hypothetical protein QOG75_890 [Mycobacterium sp.]|nr:hypothetical protein [Mycobacterium sp.]
MLRARGTGTKGEFVTSARPLGGPAGVVGPGYIGHLFAQQFAQAGYEVRAWSPTGSAHTLHDRLRQSVSTLADIGVIDTAAIDDTVSDQLARARLVPAVLDASAATEQFIPVDATNEDAEAFMMAGLSFEAFASNLRVLNMGTPEGVRPVAIWGPAILAQVQGERNAGICIFNGQLRIVSASHDPLPGYLDRVRDVIDTACWGSRRTPRRPSCVL